MNSPSMIAESEQVLNLYNQAHGDDRVKVNDTVKEWFVSEANKNGWSEATFHGNGCVLIANVEIKK
ncbi:hypothetical protein HLB27_09455 [Dickeya dadantii]|uniref:hypothetical protein n=1 Tax=Dickeya dadantii TaxID=204038 RepID=UPI001495B8D2|nr:hypothetical protein [Dickeya dadantii]NPE70850.1 hypothetical protein [Dickeya dadantii]